MDKKKRLEDFFKIFMAKKKYGIGGSFHKKIN